MTKARKTEPETETEKLEITPETTVTYGSQVTPIVKPSGFSLDKFKTKTPDLGGVATLIEGYRIILSREQTTSFGCLRTRITFGPPNFLLCACRSSG